MNSSNNFKAVISKKNYSVPIESRPIWRVSLIVSSIIVVSGAKKYLDIQKVNIWAWMLIRQDSWVLYRSFLLNESTEVPLVSVDTANFRAIEFGVSKGFFNLENGRLYIAEQGESLFKLLLENEVMTNERRFLEEYKHKLTVTKIKELTGGKPT